MEPIKVRFYRHHDSGSPTTEETVDTEAKTVRLTFDLAFIEIDHHGRSGGITAWDVRESEQRALVTYKPGDEVYIEAPSEDDCLDDSTEHLSKITRIWWRATVLS